MVHINPYHAGYFYVLHSSPIGIQSTCGIPFISTVKPVLSGHSKRRPKFVFKTNNCLMQVKSIAECSKGSILQFFRPSLSYHLPLRPLFCLYLSGSLTLYVPIATKVVCFSRLLKCLKSLYGKQCGPRSDCSIKEQSVPGPRCLLLYLICQ